MAPHSSKLVLALIVLCSGCYFYYPSTRRAKAPQAPPGTQIEVDADVHTGYRVCDNNLEGCVVRGGVLKRPYKYTVARFRYNGKVLNQGELRALAKPESHDTKYKQIEELKGTCNLSLIPSMLYAIGAVAVTIGAAGGDKLGDTGTYIAVGGAATMLGGAALSYPIGGYACMKAKRRSEESGIANDDRTRFSVNNNDDLAMERLRELGQIVDDFNERARTAERNAPEPEPGTEEAASDEAPVLPASDLPNLQAVVSADPRFVTFLRLCDALELDELAGLNDYTVLAPTEDAFAKLPAGQVNTWLSATGRDKKKVQKLVLRHFVRDKRTAQQLAAETRLRPARGSKLDVVLEGRQVVVEGGVVSDEGVSASNGIVFAIDRVFE
ncbi:MAG: fasciclin domain-containing protein [Myxococcota bacterium]|nr:fasciclin domain-containing protein [Myxococcota bacterium]